METIIHRPIFTLSSPSIERCLMLGL